MATKQQNADRFKITQREIEEDMKKVYLTGRIPMGWQEVESEQIEPHKTRVTIRLDTDMVRWFRAMGPQYQTRINKVLRLYFQGIVGGEIPIEEMVQEDERKLKIYREELQMHLMRRE